MEKLWASVLSENPWRLRYDADNDDLPQQAAAIASDEQRCCQSSVDGSPSTNYSESSSSSSTATHDSAATLSVASAGSSNSSSGNNPMTGRIMDLLLSSSKSSGGRGGLGAFAVFNPVFDTLDGNDYSFSAAHASHGFTPWPAANDRRVQSAGIGKAITEASTPAAITTAGRPHEDQSWEESDAALANHHRCHHATSAGFSNLPSTEFRDSHLRRDGSRSRRAPLRQLYDDFNRNARIKEMQSKLPWTGVADSYCRKPRWHSATAVAAVEEEASFGCHWCHNGYFRFAEQDGSPCYSFSLRGSDEVLFAREQRWRRSNCKSSSSTGSSASYTYTFYCRKDSSNSDGHRSTTTTAGAWKMRKKMPPDLNSSGSSGNWGGAAATDCNHHPHRVMANMRVMNDEAEHMMVDAGRKKCKETCFVLFAAEDSCCCRHGRTAASSAVGHGIPSRLGTEERLATADAPQEEPVGVEIAAIVIRTSEGGEEVDGDGDKGLCEGGKQGIGWSKQGWGLGFLGRSKEAWRRNRGRGGSNGSSMSLGSLLLESEEEERGRRTRSKSRRGKVEVTVVLPAAAYAGGGEEEGHSGVASPLLDRWRSGGSCACGGWDLGCRLSLFQSMPLFVPLPPPPTTASASPLLTTHDLLHWISPSQPFTISTLDHRDKKKALVIELLQPGLFSLRFEACFTPLQAFATVVAIFHQQITH